MINTDKAIDMIPYIVDIYDKLDKDYLDKSIRTGSAEEVGKKSIKILLKNIDKFKPEIFGLVAIAQDTTPEEVAKQSIIKTINTFKDIFESTFKDKEMSDFFGSFVQQATQEP